MTTVFVQSGPCLALVSLTSLGVVFAMCVCCRRKSKIIHRENQIYDPQLFQSQSERFTVARSQMERRPYQSRRELHPYQQEAASLFLPHQEDQPSYQNISHFKQGSSEPTYVDPIPASIYQNVPLINPNPDEELETYEYENVFPTLKTVNQDSDSSDYENAEFLHKIKEDMEEEDDEPDYINAESEITA
ncbi:hypothetical protein MATL_G00120940 [Megalops atlanticus]|uniref:Linker for activation of T-cells family member 2 n=1 Tax=Megalops atlanticus TaxID=7932 RepID=A0A9D3Q0W1_MEGAT|nr:hypothetical protein MATL_G00120940 [Megalops atlanticus]